MNRSGPRQLLERDLIDLQGASFHRSVHFSVHWTGSLRRSGGPVGPALDGLGSLGISVRVQLVDFSGSFEQKRTCGSGSSARLRGFRLGVAGGVEKLSRKRLRCRQHGADNSQTCQCKQSSHILFLSDSKRRRARCAGESKRLANLRFSALCRNSAITHEAIWVKSSRVRPATGPDFPRCRRRGPYRGRRNTGARDSHRHRESRNQPVSRVRANRVPRRGPGYGRH
jgi:hypothetical protein